MSSENVILLHLYLVEVIGFYKIKRMNETINAGVSPIGRYCRDNYTITSLVLEAGVGGVAPLSGVTRDKRFVGLSTTRALSGRKFQLEQRCGSRRQAHVSVKVDEDGQLCESTKVRMSHRLGNMV